MRCKAFSFITSYKIEQTYHIKIMWSRRLYPLPVFIIAVTIINICSAFSISNHHNIHHQFTIHRLPPQHFGRKTTTTSSNSRQNGILSMSNNDTQEREEEEKIRIKILGDRRKQIRSTLKNAEKLRNFRIKNGASKKKYHN